MKLTKHLTRIHNLFTNFTPSPPTNIPSQNYLLGLRALLTLQSFLYTFVDLFLPSATWSSTLTNGPPYALLLRKTLSPLLFNSSLLTTLTILLSARTLPLPFITNPTRTNLASSLFRRPIRLFLPTLAASLLSLLALSTTPATQHSTFLALTHNTSTPPPQRFDAALPALNALFNLFWLNKRYAAQAANQAFPSRTLWHISVLFQQSYTVYATVLIVPYTRASWRVKALLMFIATAFWVQSWAWYSITGLLLADGVANMGLRERLRAGWRVGGWFRLPGWVGGAVLVAVGLALQYLWVGWRPEWRNRELRGHTGLYTGGSLNEEGDVEEPGARVDCWCVVLGVMLVVEAFEGARKVLGWRGLVVVGRRSFSVFLMQPLLMYTAGVKLYMHMHGKGASHELATFVCFVVCVPLVVSGSEIFYRVVDVPSVVLAKKTWAWFQE